jgi:hypothetical protein
VTRITGLLLLLCAAPAFADVYHLLDGDRITGKTVSKAGNQYRVQTAFGRLTIPRARIQRIVKDDGSEEVVNAPPVADKAKAPAPTPPPTRLVLIVTGASFWHAWAPAKDAPAPDATLRLDVSLDEEPVATYVDAQPDPDIPGAVVNAFSFDAGIAIDAPAGVTAQAPEARPGRISLKLDLPADRAGERRLRVAYQVNDGTKEAPAWRDVASSSIHATLEPDTPNFIRLRQDRGRMEFSGFGRRKMKNVETFRIEMGME